MAFFNVKTAAVQPDRRIARRFIVDCAARLIMAGSNREGRITDLSENGARFEGENLPAAGTSGYLCWGDVEHYCTVIWAGETLCGVKFERPIATGLIEATSSHVEVSVKPVAAVGRIPLGQRRSRGLVSGD